MSDLPKLFCLVNDGAELAVYRMDDEGPWFIIEARKCGGATTEQKAVAFNEAVKHVRTGFGPLAEYKELRAASLPGIKA